MAAGESVYPYGLRQDKLAGALGQADLRIERIVPFVAVQSGARTVAAAIALEGHVGRFQGEGVFFSECRQYSIKFVFV